MAKRHLNNAILAFCGFAAAPHALALGFGRIPESIVFGQPLDLSVPLRLDPGESVSPACLQAEVSIGEQRLPADAVRVSLERVADGAEGTRLRLRSTVAVQEPLVAVKLVVGCNGSVSRQFVLFADPLNHIAPGSAEAPATAGALAVADVPPARPEPGAVRAEPTPASAVAKTTRANKAKAPAQLARADAPRKRVSARAAASTRPAVRAAERAAERAVPRLKLEEPDERLQAAISAVAAQDAAAAGAAMAASAAQAAASAAEQRLALLEKNLQDVRADAAAHRATVEQMRQRVGQAEQHSRWIWALALAVFVLCAFALWLGLRLRALQRERQAGWWVAAQAPAAGAHAAAESDVDAVPLAGPPPNTPFTAASSLASFTIPPVAPYALPTSLLPTANAIGTAAQARPAAEQPRDAAPGVYRSAALAGAVTAQEALTRAVSVDELIDLEQQAEFFVVLGEEDAAVDLLMSHLRSTGGISPLPYLKLLEIYRRRQDPEAYERMRKRFQHRFNAVAPDWQTDPDEGRDLQDYPGVLAAVQGVWKAPLDAMAELENMLFRKRSNELFELPAYRDVLTLFAVARDLHRLDGQEADDVDVLLPLLTEHDMSATVSNSIFDRLDRSAEAVGAVVEDRPTAPIDLDLSETASAGATLQRVY